MYEDLQDYQQLHRLILLQAKEDYIKLMHPKRRRKRHLAEAWVSATSCIFDRDWCAEILVNEWNDPMTLEDLAKAAMDRDNVDITKFRDAIREEARAYWEDKNLRTIKIPKNVIICEHVYHVIVTTDETKTEYEVNYEDPTIYLFDSKDANKELALCSAITEVIAYHTEARLSKTARTQLTEEWYQTLRMNNCFTGD